MTTAHIAGSTIGLVSVNVGGVGYLGERRGAIVESGILKHAVSEPFVRVTLTNLAGDEQADLRVHGGPDKAVYAYPSEHVAWWTAELNPKNPLGPGSFGENLTVTGWTEDIVQIGDVWQWGTAMLQVCQPRYPCFKLSMATGQPRIGKLMVTSGRTGWYLRVLEEGEGPTDGPIFLSDRSSRLISVLDAHRARLPGAAPKLIQRVVGEESLSAGLRADLQHEINIAVRPRVNVVGDEAVLE
ncbi:MOSC domain-containing protein [soil metagenome]